MERTLHTKKAFRNGLLGSFGLAGLYVGILTFAQSFQHAVDQFLTMWPWISLLVVGFGIQIGLYSLMRLSIKAKTGGASAEVAATGGVSAAAMVACCAHHLIDILPILGVSAAAVFLSEFQIPFIVLGIVSNLVGICVMLRVMQKHGLHPHSRFFELLLSINLKRVSTAVVAISAGTVALTFLFVGARADADASSRSGLSLSSLLNDENYVSFEVTPVDFRFDQPLVLEVRMNTHQVDLSFDLLEVSRVTIDESTTLEPTAWEGSPSGGHHRDGKLMFPGVPGSAETLTLTVSNVAGVPERVFAWQLE